jgi:hypothetical protein
MVLQNIENALNIRFMFDKIYPTVATKIIDKANIIFKTSGRRQRRPPNICMNKFKRRMRNTR